MNLAEMRTSLASRVGLGDGDFSEADLDRALGRIWRYAIPNRLGGAAVRGLRTITTTSGQDTYDMDAVFPGEIRAIQQPILVADRRLCLYSDPELFWSAYAAQGASQGTPDGVLVDGRRLVLRPVPDSAMSVYVQCLSYRAALTADGVADEVEADAVVCGAAAALASELGMEEIEARMSARYEAGLAELLHKYGANAEAMPAAGMEF